MPGADSRHLFASIPGLVTAIREEKRPSPRWKRRASACRKGWLLSQLRCDLEDNAGSLRPTGLGRAINIAGCIQDHVAKGFVAISPATKVVEGGVNPSALGLRELENVAPSKRSIGTGGAVQITI